MEFFLVIKMHLFNKILPVNAILKLFFRVNHDILSLNTSYIILLVSLKTKAETKYFLLFLLKKKKSQLQPISLLTNHVF